MSVDELMDNVDKSQQNWVCLTGGEPLLQRDSPELVKRIVDSGRKVLLETSGSLPIEKYVFSDSIVIDMDIKTPSSNEQDSLLVSNLRCLRKNDYVKFVISDEKDYKYAKDFLAHHLIKCEVVMQPAWGSDLKWLVETALRDKLNVRVLPQMHKIIWGERRGV